jgi:hypothetical protein
VSISRRQVDAIARRAGRKPPTAASRGAVADALADLDTVLGDLVRITNDETVPATTRNRISHAVLHECADLLDGINGIVRRRPPADRARTAALAAELRDMAT